MTTSRIKLYLDEDVPVVIAEIARSSGFDAITARDADRHQRSLSDASQLDYATQQGRTILTHNRDDFIKLDDAYRAQGRDHAGIIIAIRRSVVYDVAQRLLVLLNHVTAEEIRSQRRFV